MSDKLANVAVEPDQVVVAMNFLHQVKLSKNVRREAGLFSNDLAKIISGATGKPITAGACVAASVALGFPSRSWLGVTDFRPDALIALRRQDVWRKRTMQ